MKTIRPVRLMLLSTRSVKKIALCDFAWLAPDGSISLLFGYLLFGDGVFCAGVRRH